MGNCGSSCLDLVSHSDHMVHTLTEYTISGNYNFTLRFLANLINRTGKK